MNLDEFTTIEQLAAAIKSLDMVTAVPWTDYSGTSTITGWSSYTTKFLEYKKNVDGLVFVQFRITGTSDTTTCTFTVPFAEGIASSIVSGILCGNGANGRAIGFLSISSSTVAFTPTATLGSSGWLNSGTKEIFGQFFYEVA